MLTRLWIQRYSTTTVNTEYGSIYSTVAPITFFLLHALGTSVLGLSYLYNYDNNVTTSA